MCDKQVWLMLKGSCACNQVRYEIHGSLISPITYCHCWRCRKHSGSSFGTTASIDGNALHFVAGEKYLSSWESSPGVHRYFARCCGSPIYKREASNPAELRLRLGTLDSDPLSKVEMHYMADSVAPWVELDKALKMDPSGPPFGSRD